MLGKLSDRTIAEGLQFFGLVSFAVLGKVIISLIPSGIRLSSIIVAISGLGIFNPGIVSGV